MTRELPSAARDIARIILTSATATEADRAAAARVLAEPVEMCPPCPLCVFTPGENARIAARGTAAYEHTIASRRAHRAAGDMAGTFYTYRNDQAEAAYAAYAATEAETFAIIRERLDIDA